MDQHTDFDAFALRASGLHYADSGTDTDTDNDSDTDNSKQDHHHNDNDDYAVGITRDDDGSRMLMNEDDEFFGLAAKVPTHTIAIAIAITITNAAAAATMVITSRPLRSASSLPSRACSFRSRRPGTARATTRNGSMPLLSRFKTSDTPPCLPRM